MPKHVSIHLRWDLRSSRLTVVTLIVWLCVPFGNSLHPSKLLIIHWRWLLISQELLCVDDSSEAPDLYPTVCYLSAFDTNTIILTSHISQLFDFNALRKPPNTWWIWGWVPPVNSHWTPDYVLTLLKPPIWSRWPRCFSVSSTCSLWPYTLCCVSAFRVKYNCGCVHGRSGGFVFQVLKTMLLSGFYKLMGIGILLLIGHFLPFGGVDSKGKGTHSF